MAYDSTRGQVIMFGGAKSKTSFFNDTWAYDGKDWKLLSPKNSPSARGDHQMVYDPARARIVLFGGTSVVASQTVHYSDTWEWNGTDWTEAKPGSGPSDRSGHAMAYNPLRATILLFGGSKGTMA